ESKRDLARLHALCTLDGMDVLQPALLEKALADSSPGVRRHAVRLCETRFRLSKRLGSAIVNLAKDPADPQVRMQLAYTLGEWEARPGGRVWGPLGVKHESDRYLLGAVMSSVNKKNLDDMLVAFMWLSTDQAPPPALVSYLLEMGQALGNPGVTAKLLKKA